MMHARDHTDRLLTWWRQHGIDRLDLAVRRPDGAWIYHHARHNPDPALLAWARFQNHSHADIYIRPARGRDWPHLFLDDLPISTARELAGCWHVLIVHTSRMGGCHLHVILEHPISEVDRGRLQRLLAFRYHADPAATAGAQLQRLPGMRNWKRDGVWVNVIPAIASAHRLDPTPLLRGEMIIGNGINRNCTRRNVRAPAGTDHSASGYDWALVCSRLEAGDHPDHIAADLLAAVHIRRGQDAQRYVSRTLTAARNHTGC